MKSAHTSRRRLARLLQVKKIRRVTAENYMRKLRDLSEKVIDHEKAELAAKIFSAISDPVRIRILRLLEKESMCVCELTEALNMRQPLVSYHLKLLKEAELIRPVKKGKWVFYKISDKKLLRAINKIIELA